MRRAVFAATCAVVMMPAVASWAAPADSHAWSFADYTPDPSSLAASEFLHVATGAAIPSYCGASRVPSAPQDVNTRQLKLKKRSVLKLQITTTGAWGLDVTTSRGKPITGLATTPGAPSSLSVRLAPGAYSVTACNLGGSPTATVTYALSKA